MKEIISFENEQFGKIRSLTIDNEPWFVGKDIAEMLIYKEPHKAVTNHVDKDDRIKYPIIDEIGRTQETWLINESGLYSLILSSKLPKAKEFKRWVTSEVLPSIRKTGSYDASTSELLKQLAQSQINTNLFLTNFKSQIESNLELTKEKLEKHDKLLEKRIYLSPKEALDVQKAVTQKVKYICYEKNLAYQFVRKNLFKRIYTSLDEYFGVATYRELPSVRMCEILDFIKNIKVYTDDLIQNSWQLDFDNEY